MCDGDMGSEIKIISADTSEIFAGTKKKCRIW
jgi:hypothetical protein